MSKLSLFQQIFMIKQEKCYELEELYRCEFKVDITMLLFSK